MEIYTIIAICIGGAIVNGLVAEEKNRNTWAAVVLSLLGCSVFVYLWLLAVPAIPRAPRVRAGSVPPPIPS